MYPNKFEGSVGISNEIKNRFLRKRLGKNRFEVCLIFTH